jgi:AhpD family alkylhydroperoxidase
MALRQVPLEELPTDFRQKVEQVTRLTGAAHFHRVAANAPQLVDFYWRTFYGQIFFGGAVDVRTKELIRLRLAGLHGCAFCRAGDAASALEHGVADKEVAAVWRLDDDAFSPAEQAALKLATILSNARPDGVVDDALKATLESHFTDEQHVELLFVIGVLTGMAKMLAGMGFTSTDCEMPTAPTGGGDPT